MAGAPSFSSPYLFPNPISFHPSAIPLSHITFSFLSTREEPMAEKKKVLIVDDDPDILEFLSYNLKKEGYEVEQATSDMHALWLLAGNPKPDLILLDLMLPGTHGFEICQYLKSTPGLKKIPVIILSARGSAEDIETGLTLGAEAYFVKASFSITSLIGLIGKLAFPMPLPQLNEALSFT